MDKLYIVSFMFESDGDFYFEDYNNLNYTTKLTNDLKYAREIILEHLKHCYESIRASNSSIANIKKHCEEIYLYFSNYGNCRNDDSDGWFHIEEDFGNPYIKYNIEEVQWLDKKLKD